MFLKFCFVQSGTNLTELIYWFELSVEFYVLVTMDIHINSLWTKPLYIARPQQQQTSPTRIHHLFWLIQSDILTRLSDVHVRIRKPAPLSLLLNYLTILLLSQPAIKHRNSATLSLSPLYIIDWFLRLYKIQVLYKNNFKHCQYSENKVWKLNTAWNE